MFEAQSLAFEAWLILNLQRILLANFKLRKTAAASRGFLAAARLSCYYRFVVCRALTVACCSNVVIFVRLTVYNQQNVFDAPPLSLIHI